MATAPKATPKVVPKVVPIEEGAGAVPSPPSKKSGKKLFIILAILFVVLGGIGAGAWYFIGHSNAEHENIDGDGADNEGAEKKPRPPVKHDASKPPVFLPMDQFTVNLQSEGVDQFLQVGFTLQVASQEQIELIKLYMPLVRSRLLLLLAAQRGSELATPEGKKKLQDDILAQVKQPFTQQAPPQAVTAVFFTSFVIQ
jgi:flagellar FliL protein